MDDSDPPAPTFTRRAFLRAAGLLGAAAAAAPLVMRAREAMADPDPPDRDADLVFIHTVCRGCEGNCGVKAKLRRGRILSLTGNPYHPHNRGDVDRVPFSRTPAQVRTEGAALCARGLAAAQLVYDPQRVQHPLRRVGPRGSGRWETVTWAAALRDIAARLNALIPFDERLTRDIDARSPDLGKVANQLVFAPGRAGERALAERIFRAGYGTVNHAVDLGSLADGARAATALATADTATGAAGVDALRPDFDRASYVLVFGGNPAESGGATPALARKVADLRDARRTGGAGRRVVVDPRVSTTAAKADLWVPIKPGGDTALALGVARVILDRARHDAAFLGNANRAAAAAAGEPCHTDATWLVVTEPGHASEGRWLTAADAGLPSPTSPASPVCIRAADGAPTEVALAAGAPAVVGRLLPTDAGRDDVSVNGVRCRSAFGLYRAAVFEQTLDQYAVASGVDAAVITQLATDLAAAGRRGSAWAAGGAVQRAQGTWAALAVLSLNWLLGNVDRAGGLTRGGGSWDERRATGGVDTTAVTNGATPTGPRVDRAGAEYASERSYFQGFPAARQWYPLATGGAAQELVPSIAQGYPYPVKALITASNEWPYAVPGGRSLWERTLGDEAALPLYVAITTTLDEAAVWADWVLPESTWLEAWGFAGPDPAVNARLTALQQPVVGAFDSVTIGATGGWAFDPTARNDYAPELPDTRTLGDILSALAKAISPRFPGVGADALGLGVGLDRAWDFYRHQVANLARNVGSGAGVASVSGPDILARGGAFAPPGSGYDPANAALLANRHGSVLHLFHARLAAAADAVTGRRPRGVAHLEPARHLDGSPVRDAAFPLQLVTWRTGTRGEVAGSASPWLVGLRPGNFVELSEPDARAAGVESGDRVRVVSASNPAGVVGVARVARGLRPGVVAVARGFGRWEGGARSHVVDARVGAYDVARGLGVSPMPVMRLDAALGDVPVHDPVGGQCSFGDTWVRVEPAGAR
jgi:anaerobic selenocysteine-containing dehydrogenase